MQESYYIFSSGNITQKDKTLRFTTVNGEIKDLPIENIKEIYIMNEVTITSKLLSLLSNHNIVVHFLIIISFTLAVFILKKVNWQVNCWSSRL